MTRYIIDEQGNPKPEPDLNKWGSCMTNLSISRIGNTEMGDVRVSTVFLGLDHNWEGGPPILWETMIFGGPHDEYMERYSTREAAIEGHARAVDLARSNAPMDATKSICN